MLSTHGPLSLTALRARYPWPADWLDEALASLVENGEAMAGAITPGAADLPEFCDRRNLERKIREKEAAGEEATFLRRLHEALFGPNGAFTRPPVSEQGKKEEKK